MATGTKTPNTSEEQDAAYNPGDAHYNTAFNQRAKSEELADLENSWATPYQGKNGAYVDTHGDTVQSNYNADEPEADENIKSAKEQEEAGTDSFYNKSSQSSGGRQGFMGKLSALGGKKLGPTGGIIGVLLIGLFGIGGSTFGLASSLLINVKELLHNDRADSTRFNRVMSRAAFSNKFNGEGEGGCTSKITIKCKISSMSRNDLKRYHDQGFKITGIEVKPDGTETGNRVENGDTSKLENDESTRIKIQQVEFPDGEKSTTGKAFWEHADNNIEARRWAERSSPSKSSFYLNKFFSDRILGQKFNTGKGKRTFPAGEGEEARKAQHAAFNEQTSGLSDEDVKNGKLDSNIKKVQEDVKSRSLEANSKAAKGGAAGEIIQGYCAVYQLAYRSKALVKAYHMTKLVSFGLMFFQAADEIKRGVGDGAKTAYLSNNLTYYETDSDSPKRNLSATDSEGYKIAAMGDKTGLKEFSKKYLLGGTIGQKLNSVTDTLAMPVTTTANTLHLGSGSDHQKMKQFCRTVQSDAATIGLACAGLIPVVVALAGGTAGIGAIPGIALNTASCACTTNSVSGVDDWSIVDTILGGPSSWASKLSNVGCNILEKLLQKMAQEILEQVMTKSVQDKIADILRELNIGSDTKGVDAGNAIAAGSQMMLSVASMGYGLRPAKTDNDNQDITNYIAATQDLENKYTELAKADARVSPFDTSNEYSFTGTLARSLNLGAIAPTSLYGNATTLSTIIPTAFKTALTGEKVNALYSQPSTAANGDSGRYNHCDDPDLKDMNGGKGVTGDTYCYIVGVVTNDELNKASDQAYTPNSQQFDQLADWMLKEQTSTEGSGGTFDDNKECANLDNSKDEGCKNSKLKSINDDGSPVTNSQYSKYLQYCTDKREVPIGTQVEPYEQGSDRDQRWYSGEQCSNDSTMMKNFRMWTNYCLQLGTSDGAPNCYEAGTTASETSSTCGDGTTASIYTCALKYDDYLYEWGGGHGDIAALVKDFNAGKYEKWTPVVDCSGLIRAAAYDAFGVVTDGGATPSVYQNNPHWKEISKEEAKMGDIVSLGNSDAEGHVVIIKSNNPSAKKWDIFHASTSGGAPEDNILHGTLDYAGDGRPVVGVYRFVK